MAQPTASLERYLEQHRLQEVLHTMANAVARALPASPHDFMIDHLLAASTAAGREPAIVARLKVVRAAVAADQEAADVAAAKVKALEAENAKLAYRVEHLCKALDELEKKAGVPPGSTPTHPAVVGGGAPGAPPPPAAAVPAAASAVPAVAEIPLGHSRFSWAGGVQLAAGAAGAPPSAPAAGADGGAGGTQLGNLGNEPFSARVAIGRLLRAGRRAVGQRVTVCGWVKTNRKQKERIFIELNDGSSLDNVQLLVDGATEGREPHATAAGASTGASMRAVGVVVESPGKQEIELKAESVELLGPVDAASYPLAKKGHTLEFLREVAHLRPRTNTLGAVMRIRNELAFGTHEFFRTHGFLYVHTPIVTASDCEGAGEMFQVTTHKLASAQPYRPEDDFFGKEAFLTVSGQLNGEYYACALSSIYTFGPTFRAEPSHTARHLAEFWMIEPEIAFATLKEDMDLAEAYLKHCFGHVLRHCHDDLAFLSKMYHKPEMGAPLLERLRAIVGAPFTRVSYTDAITHLQSAVRAGKEFKYEPVWGEELQTEHERHLCEVTFKGPVIVHDYPKGCKAFYMRLNDDDKTVAAMDVLFPKVGEMVGGSQREERLDVLLRRMEEAGLDQETYKAYIDTRRCGTQPHAGFGVGFERLVLYATSMDNIRDVIPFPRWEGNALF